jgi:hypothetical protein
MKKETIYTANMTVALDPYNIAMSMNDYNNIAKFIAEIDQACEDWEMTIKLIAHFKALEGDLKTHEGDNFKPIKPKKIKM